MPRIEVASTGRARCQSCGQGIAAGSVRVACKGALGGAWRGRRTKMVNKYHHSRCYSRGSQTEFQGFFALPKAAQAEVRARDPATIKYLKEREQVTESLLRAKAQEEAASASKVAGEEATAKKVTKKRKAESSDTGAESSSPMHGKKVKLMSSPSETGKDAVGAQLKATSKTTVKRLKAELLAAGLSTTGRKAELLARVVAHREGRVDEATAAKGKKPSPEKVKKKAVVPRKVTRKVKFAAVGMKFRGHHRFSSRDNISLQADPCNPVDPNAIKVLVGKSHVAFVSGKHAPALHAFLPKVTRVDFVANVTGYYGTIASATLAATYDA